MTPRSGAISYGSTSIATRSRAQPLTLGYWSATIAAISAVLFAALAITFPAPPWSDVQAYARDFDAAHMASFAPAMTLAVSTLVLIACLNAVATAEQRACALAGLALAVVYTSIVCANYYLQLFVVRLNLQNGTFEGLALLAIPNLRSIFFGFEAIGYCFAGLATLAVSPLFGNGPLATGIRRLYIANGLLGIYGAVVALFDAPLLVFAGLGIWCVIFPAGAALNALWFRRLGQVHA